MSSMVMFLLIISYLIDGGLARFGSQLDDKIIDSKFEIMGEVRIEEFSVVNDVTTLEVVVEDTIDIDELWIVDFQPLDYNDQFPIVLKNGSLSSRRTGTCSSIYRDADWEDDYFDDKYFMTSDGQGEKDFYNTFVRGNVTELNQRHNEIAFNGDLITLLDCQQKDGTKAWKFEIFYEEIQYQSLLYASNVRPITDNWTPGLGTNLQVAYVQTHFKLIWRMSRFAILNTSLRTKDPSDDRRFLIIGQPEIIDEVGLITVFFDFAVVDVVYENGSPNPSKTYLTMGISTTITDGQSTMLSFKDDSLQYIPRNKGNAIDFIHQQPSSDFDETPACKPWKLDDVCEQSWYFEFEISLNLTGMTQDIPVDATGDFVFAFYTYQCDYLHNKADCALLDINPWYLSADVTLQTVVTVIDEEQETIRVNVIEVSNDQGDLRGGTDVGHNDNVTMTVNLSPAYLRKSFVLELSLFMVCFGAEFVESTRGCLAADEDDRYTGFVSDDFVLDYDPATDPVEMAAMADFIESQQSEDEEEATGVVNDKGQILDNPDEDGYQWTLVMKATAGIGEGLYDIWTNPGGLNELEPDSQILNDEFVGHYKNSIVDEWDLLQVRKVKLALYTDEEEVVYFIFDGIGSTADSWFSQNCLIDTTFTDLNADIYVNYFSIAGHSRANLHRRWFINKSYADCGNDRGWFAVIDGVGVCPWENNIGGSPPQFLYSPGTTYNRWRPDTSQFADVFAIFVEHQKFPVPSLVSTSFIYTQETTNLYTLNRGFSKGSRGDTPQSTNFNLLTTDNEYSSTRHFIMVANATSQFPAIVTDDETTENSFTVNSIFYEVNQEIISNNLLERFYSAVSFLPSNLISYIGNRNPQRLTCLMFDDVEDPAQFFLKYKPVWVNIDRGLLDYFLRLRELYRYLLSVCNHLLVNNIDALSLRRSSISQLEDILQNPVVVYELLSSKIYFREMGLLDDNLFAVLNVATLSTEIDEAGEEKCKPVIVYNIIYVIVITQDMELIDFIDPLLNLNFAINFIYDLIETTEVLLPTAVFQTLTNGVLNGTYSDTEVTVKNFISDLYDFLAPGRTLSIPFIDNYEEEFYRSFVNIVIGRKATLNGKKLVPSPFETTEPEYIDGKFRQGYVETCHINWDTIVQFWTFNSPYYKDVPAFKGGWDSWADWESCSVKCGGGLQIRTRECLDDINGCFGESLQTRACNPLRCEIYINKQNFGTQLVFINSTMTSAEAVQYCDDVGSHLPDIDDLDLMKALLDYMTNMEDTYIEAVYVLASSEDDLIESSECKLLFFDGKITSGEDCSEPFNLFCQSDYVNVLKVEAGSGVNVYDIWTGSDTISDEIGTTASSIFSTETFKSQFVEEWNTDISIEEVRIMLLDDDLKSVWKMTFNGSLTDKIDWFSEENVLTSQYNDLEDSGKTFFSIQGNKRAERRFYINDNCQGCHLDSGWFMVLDNPGHCAWEENFAKSSPQFMYSGGKTQEVWAENDNFARMFVISLKFRNEAGRQRGYVGAVAERYRADSVTPPTEGQQLNFAEYDREQALHETQFTNKAMSGVTAEYTLTAVYSLTPQNSRRKRQAQEDDDDYYRRHRRSLDEAVKKPQLRNIRFSFLGCPEDSTFNPIDRTCYCNTIGHVVQRIPYKCAPPTRKIKIDKDKIEIIIEGDRSKPNSSTKKQLFFYQTFIFVCLGIIIP
ncbi:uncharacterized protein [Antedon mediterranea]|uniref:uncharacterized protein n=1 Tax=Antedon mediterranea TaxID=105859 RepID=UPI003AF51726